MPKVKSICSMENSRNCPLPPFLDKCKMDSAYGPSMPKCTTALSVLRPKQRNRTKKKPKRNAVGICYFNFTRGSRKFGRNSKGSRRLRIYDWILFMIEINCEDINRDRDRIWRTRGNRPIAKAFKSGFVGGKSSKID